MENQLIAVVVILLLALIVFWNRLSRFWHRPEGEHPYSLRQLDTSEQEIAELRKLPPSPITMISFQQAMASNRLEGEIERYCRGSLGNVLTGDVINGLVETGLLSSDQMTLVCKFSPEATKLLETGQASIPLHRGSGRLLPFMHDKSGRIIEHAKAATQRGLMLAQAWALVVSVAHVISGMDVVERLKEIDSKLLEVVAGRYIDQDSKLDGIYTEACGILRGGIDAAAIHRLRTCRSDLYSLRTIWCREIARLVRLAVLPDRPLWHHSSWWRRGNREKKTIASLAPIVEKLQRLRVAVLTDWYLSIATGATENFCETVAPSEQSLLAPVSAEMGQLTAGFRKQVAAGQLEMICAGVDCYLDLLKVLAGQEFPALTVSRPFQTIRP